MTKQEAVYEALRDGILRRVLPEGSRLPSTRVLAERWLLSRGTVETAFDRLCAEGYLFRTPGSGTSVSATVPDDYVAAGRPKVPTPRELETERQEIEAIQTRASGAEGRVRVGVPLVARLPDPALFPVTDWSRNLAKAVGEATIEQLTCSDPGGLPGLRREIAGYLRRYRDVRCTDDDVMVTTGIRHAVDLIARSTLAPGDEVCVEDPGYPSARQIFALAGAKITSIPVDDQGISVDALTRRPETKIVYVTPAHQSPLGVTMSVTRRLELLDWARSSGAWIIEDDYDSEFNYSNAPLPAMMSLDLGGRTIYCGSFNKTLLPGLRVGFIVAPIEMRRRLVQLWQTTGRSVAVSEQLALETYIRTGAFARHLRVARQAYAERRDMLLRILSRGAEGRYAVSGQHAGFHLVLWLKNGQGEQTLCRRAASEGVVLQPLSEFCHVVELPPAVVLGYTALTLGQVSDAAERIARLLAA